MVTSFAFLDLGTPDLLLILVIILILFGAKKLPDLSKSLGQSIRELRKGINGEDEAKKDDSTKQKPTKV